MRVFKRLNVVKVTDDEQKAAKLLADGFVEIIAEDKPVATAKKRSSRKADVAKDSGAGEADGEPDEAEAPAGD